IFSSLLHKAQHRLSLDCDAALRKQVLFVSDLVVLDLEFELVFFVTHQLEKGSDFRAVAASLRQHLMTITMSSTQNDRKRGHASRGPRRRQTQARFSVSE